MAKIYGEIPSSALMTFDKSFARSNGQPLDSTEVFYSLTAAEEYAKGDVAYVSQKIAVVETVDDVTTVTHYGIEADGSLKELGAVPVGDGLTVEVVDGKISIVGVNDVDEDGNPVLDSTKKYQPILLNGKITWAEISATTVEGLAAEIETINSEIDDLQAADTELDVRIDALEATVGKAAEGDNTATGLVKEVADVKADLADNYYDKTEVDAKVAGAFHFKGDAAKLENGTLYKDVDGTETEIADMQAGDVYQVGEVEYAYDGTEWVKLGFTLDLSNYNTETEVDNKISAAKAELQTYADTAETDAINTVLGTHATDSSYGVVQFGKDGIKQDVLVNSENGKLTIVGGASQTIEAFMISEYVQNDISDNYPVYRHPSDLTNLYNFYSISSYEETTIKPLSLTIRYTDSDEMMTSIVQVELYNDDGKIIYTSTGEEDDLLGEYVFKTWEVSTTTNPQNLASTTEFGRVKIGNDLAVTDGVVSVDRPSLLGEDITGTVQEYVEGVIADADAATATDLENLEKKVDDHIAAMGDMATKNVVSLADLNSEEGELKSVIEGKADKATTLAGYGITDAYTQDQLDTMFENAETNAALAAEAAANIKANTGDLTVKEYVDQQIGNAGHATTAQLAALESSVDTKLAGKANATHEHEASQITGLGTLATKSEVSYTMLDSALKETIDGKANTTDLKALAKKDKVAETDLEDALATKINGKADKATTLAGYGITDAYTKTESDQKIADAVGNAAHLKREIVDELPAAEDVDVNTIYMIPKETDEAGNVVGNVYHEYMWIASTNKWEKIGDTSVDLTDYLTKAGEADNLTIDGSPLSDVVRELDNRSIKYVAQYVTTTNNATTNISLGNLQTALRYEDDTILSIISVELYDSTGNMVIGDIKIDRTLPSSDAVIVVGFTEIPESEVITVVVNMNANNMNIFAV